MKQSNSRAIRVLGKAMNELQLRQPVINLVHSNPYSWYEIRIRKLNQTATTRIPRPNPAGLKLVG
jgi:hypothetical protein